MQQSFHLFLREHHNQWYTGTILTHPQYVAYAAKPTLVRDQLRDVLARDLATKTLVLDGPTFFENLQQKTLRFEMRAVQHGRLILVPMRFSIFYYPLEERDQFEVHIPRLRRHFTLADKENIEVWSEEVIRGFFHLENIEEFLQYQYERGEKVEEFEVVYHGAGRYKKFLQSQKEDEDITTLRSEMITPLKQVGVNLTEEAKEGRIPRAHFRDELLKQFLAILSGKQGRSVLLIGPSGVGKTALVQEAAHRIILKQTPERLHDVPIWNVTGGRIIAGMKFLGQWQERFLSVLEELRSQQGILYVDSLLELMTAGSSMTGLNVAQMLLPFIQKDDVTVIAEATPDALSIAEQMNSAFVQSFRRLPIPSFSADQSYEILERASKKIGKEHKVNFTPPALHRALDVLARFGEADALPGSGLRLIEQMARLQPPGTERRDLFAIDAIDAFSKQSGFPKDLIDPEKLLDVDTVRRYFLERVIGQEHAMQLLSNLVMLIKASLNDPQKPLGSFLFMGPTGVGKTESALTLAEYLFSDKKRLLRLDMSEYAYPGSSYRLVGGVDGQGDLSRKIREQPFSIVLLDEIEKADPSVFDVLLQVLGEGRLTDMSGQTVRFTHTILIMTSNLGATQKSPVGFGGGPTHQALEKHYQDAAEKFFRPEFINRIDFLVPFHPLDRPSIQSIAKRMLEQALDREGFRRREISVRYEDEIIDYLMKTGFHPKYGARPMKRAIEQNVLIPVSRRLIRRKEQAPETFSLYISDERIAVVSDRPLKDAFPPRLTDLELSHDALWMRYLSQSRLRLQSWEESFWLKNLRLTSPDHPIFSSLRLVEEAFHRAELLGASSPSKLPSEQAANFRLHAKAADDQRLALESELCAFVLKGGDRLTLDIEIPGLQPTVFSLAEDLVAAYKHWGEERSIRVLATSQTYGFRLEIEGPKARLWLREEIGLHRLQHDKDPLFLRILEPGLSTDDLPTIREYSAEPPGLWDLETEVEIPAPSSSLPAHLSTFLLARLVFRVSQTKPPSKS